ncbi:Heat shock 70 kDa protein 12A [Entophlyctis sp. JEL0112]|nr:Heat shock 70 kDa protein 12A [Entophlyctis sp. JEL0112]
MIGEESASKDQTLFQQDESASRELFKSVLDPTSDKKAVVAIDFGTTGVGYAWAFPSSNGIKPSEVFDNPPWPNSVSQAKTPTAVLLNAKNCSVVAFGAAALDKALNLRTSDRPNFYLFHRFKMALYNTDSPLTAETTIVDELNQKPVKAITIIAACLRHIKESTKLTVPAIWKDNAKQIMHIAAHEAGLETNNQGLILALEPEGASFWWMKTTDTKPEVGDIYVVADCGGGTIDVSVHEVMDTQGTNGNKLREAFPVTGGDWGSTVIDRRFFEFLEALFGHDRYDNFKKRDFITLQLAWERAKCAFDGSADSSVPLPESLTLVRGDVKPAAETIEEYNESNGSEYEFEANRLIISAKDMAIFFDPVVNTTVAHLKSVVKKLEKDGSKPSMIVCVGSFSQSTVLTNALKAAFAPDINVIIPNQAGSCVVRGAVLLGAGGIADAPIKISRFGYGTKTVRLPQGDDPPEKIQNGLTRDVLDLFVDYGDDLEPGFAKEAKFYPTDKQQRAITFEFYATSKADVRFVTDRAAKKIGQLRIQGDPVSLQSGQQNMVAEDATAFADILAVSSAYKAVCAIDFGTTGIGMAYSLKTQINDPEHEISVFSTWPLAGAGKTASAILIKDGKCISFGSKAVEKVSTLRSKERTEYIFLRHFKMALYAETNVNERTMLRDEVSKKSILAVEAIRMCLVEVKNAFIEEANNKGYALFEKHVLWVVTVPAIWKESAKKLMRLGAEKAGLKNLRIVLEPEGASTWVLSLKENRKADKLKHGDVFIVADCGGGTIDVTVHEVMAGADSKVKEVVKASGGDWGSTVIDRAFYKMLDDVFGKEKMNRFRADMAQFAQLQDAWEKKKCSFDGESDVLIYVASLKENAQDDVDIYNETNGTDLELDNNNLVIPPETMKNLFADAVNTTVAHLKSIISKGIQPACIMLVGNFANSTLLQDATRRAFQPKVRVVIPPFPGNCVVAGAVLYTCKPSVISERVTKFAYGVETLPIYDESKGHIPQKKVLKNDEWRCEDVMSWIVSYGQRISHGQTFWETYYPIFPGQKVVTFKIFSGVKENILFSTDRGCKQLGTIESPECDPALLREKGVRFLMLFDTEIHVDCIGPDGKRTSATLTLSE